MTKEREALKMALETLEKLTGPADLKHPYDALDLGDVAIVAIKELLAQPEQELTYKVTVVDDQHPNGIPLKQWGQQPEQERNFCHRCGKRLMSALGPVSLHTCCPPNGRTFDDYGNKIV